MDIEDFAKNSPISSSKTNQMNIYISHMFIYQIITAICITRYHFRVPLPVVSQMVQQNFKGAPGGCLRLVTRVNRIIDEMSKRRNCAPLFFASATAKAKKRRPFGGTYE